MKQRITSDQLQQLTPSQQEKLRAWWKPEIGDKFDAERSGITWLVASVNGERIETHAGIFLKNECLPLLSIGQCLQILGEHNRYYELRNYENNFHFYDQDNLKSKSPELIDALFEAVKSIL